MLNKNFTKKNFTDSYYRVIITKKDKTIQIKTPSFLAVKYLKFVFVDNFKSITKRKGGTQNGTGYKKYWYCASFR